jgi:hypothetical protein
MHVLGVVGAHIGCILGDASEGAATASDAPLDWTLLLAALTATLTAVYFTHRYFNPSTPHHLHLEHLFIYPVKSCAEVPLTKALALPGGFQGDRMLQVTDANGRYCTPREPQNVQLFHIQCSQPTADELVLRSPHSGDHNQPFRVQLKGPGGGGAGTGSTHSSADTISRVWPEFESELVAGTLRPAADQKEQLVDFGVRCTFSDRILHSKMPLDPTHVRLKQTCM